MKTQYGYDRYAVGPGGIPGHGDYTGSHRRGDGEGDNCGDPRGIFHDGGVTTQTYRFEALLLLEAVC